MKEHDSFIIYKSFYEPIKGLSDEQLGRLLRAIFEWQINGQPGTLGQDIEIAFGFFTNQFRVDNEKWENRCRINRENGRKGGRPLKTKRFSENQTVIKKPKKPDNDNDNDNDNGNENGIRKKELILPYLSPEFVDTWNELRTQPKWKRKTKSALQKSLDALGRYDEQFSIELMNQAIAGGYQGVVFPGTEERYRQSQKVSSIKTVGRVIKDLSDIYE